MRGAAFQALGALSKFGTGVQHDAFLEQVHGESSSQSCWITIAVSRPSCVMDHVYRIPWQRSWLGWNCSSLTNWIEALRSYVCKLCRFILLFLASFFMSTMRHQQCEMPARSVLSSILANFSSHDPLAPLIVNHCNSKSRQLIYFMGWTSCVGDGLEVKTGGYQPLSLHIWFNFCLEYHIYAQVTLRRIVPLLESDELSSLVNSRAFDSDRRYAKLL